ncbi:hypothetical protein I4U23_026278 [Adineta vaga]|uniref:DUF288 containing protein n=1 Tax=Adineta vaga TaxID=104782 RepID=B3G3W8_ADIVA|nr:DUF288 containing protein [Adineta vaga]UJR23258.1 hypothetical protein I4U23_026278 [Adineta vaga]
MVRSKNSLLLIIMCAIFLLLMIKLFSDKNVEKLFLLRADSDLSSFSLWNTKQSSTYVCPIRGDKWIVITTIHYPTQAIYKFLNLTTPWNLIIIADRKTPTHWLKHLNSHNTSRLLFLSLQQQQQHSLHFRILQFLPQGSYARKNLGYLIAIQCGAQIIFESDDDNLLENNDIYLLPKLLQPKHLPWFAFHRQRSLFVNIYASFGHPHIWPRGFPIDQLRNLTEDGWHSLRQNQQNITHAYIQQYLADLDPDVDAIYRLAHPMTIGRVQFDRDQPPIALESFTFSPYNTQNTVTYYEAFWGLYLPVTTTFRVCDIWRGYWVQRLLWDIGGHLIFGRSTVQQIRNSHSYIEDMDDEYQLYHQSASFVRFLASWSSSNPSLVGRIRELARAISQGGFWKWKEVEITDAWLDDLRSVGYKFPSIVASSPSAAAAAAPPPSSSSSPRPAPKEKRAAVCVTGIAECVPEAWSTTHINLRRRIRGDIDTFLFLSSSFKQGPVPLHTRLKQARLYMNSTVTILYEDRIIDPGIPSTCNAQFQLPHHALIPVPAYFQQLWSLNECYDLVKEYEKKFNIRYQLLIRTRVDTLVKMPISFEREGILNVNTTILVPPHRYFPGIDDGFALGPMELMSHYMKRWLSLQQCPPDENFQPETYLKNYLNRFTNITVDNTISGAADAILHGHKYCH